MPLKTQKDNKKSTKATPVKTLPPVQTPPTELPKKPTAFDLINKPLSPTDAADLDRFSDYGGTGLSSSAPTLDSKTIQAMQGQMNKFGWGRINNKYPGSLTVMTTAGMIDPADYKKGVSSGNAFALVAPAMVHQGIKNAKLMGINSRAAFLNAKDIIFKGVNDEIRNNPKFNEFANGFYEVAANIFEDRLKNYVPTSAATAPAPPTAPTPTPPVTTTTTLPPGR